MACSARQLVASSEGYRRGTLNSVARWAANASASPAGAVRRPAAESGPSRPRSDARPALVSQCSDVAASRTSRPASTACTWAAQGRRVVPEVPYSVGGGETAGLVASRAVAAGRFTRRARARRRSPRPDSDRIVEPAATANRVTSFPGNSNTRRGGRHRRAARLVRRDHGTVADLFAQRRVGRRGVAGGAVQHVCGRPASRCRVRSRWRPSPAAHPSRWQLDDEGDTPGPSCTPAAPSASEVCSGWRPCTHAADTCAQCAPTSISKRRTRGRTSGSPRSDIATPPRVTSTAPPQSGQAVGTGDRWVSSTCAGGAAAAARP